MSQSHPNDELSIELLVRALAGVLDPNSRVRRNLLKLDPSKIFSIERELSETLAVIRATRNSHIPINRLPPETLSGILQHQDCWRDRVAATHVCRYWRSALISSPSLWTSLQLRSDRDVDRTLTYLARSKSMVIDIGMELDSLPSFDIPRHLAPHMSRTKSFVIEGTPDVHTASSLLLCNPVPFLEHLEMKAQSDSVRDLENFLGQGAPSLRSATFVGIHPALECSFPLPSLTKLILGLPKEMGSLQISLLLRLCSNCPRLEDLSIKISCEMIQDILAPGQVTSLDLLVKLEYTSDTPVQFLPFLRLPQLKHLVASSPWKPGKVDKLADILPNDGRLFLSRATAVSHRHGCMAQSIELSGEGVNALFHLSDINTGPIGGRFLDQLNIPFEQIEYLDLQGVCIPIDYAIDLFQNLTKLRVEPFAGDIFTQWIFNLLLPRSETVIPCPSLREVEYTCVEPDGSDLGSLIEMVKKRKRAEHQLELLCVLSAPELGPDRAKELGEHVGELKFDREKENIFIFVSVQPM